MNRTERSAPEGVNLLALRQPQRRARAGPAARRRGEEGISGLELAEGTGLTPQAVSKITARLRAGGLVVERGPPRLDRRQAAHGAAAGPGRAVRRRSRTWTGTDCAAVLVDLAGAVVAERRAPLDLGAGADAVGAAVAREVRSAVAGAVAEAVTGAGAVAGTDRAGRVLGVGVALPGPLDHTRGVLHPRHRLPRVGRVPAARRAGRRLGMPVVVDKDTNAAALSLAVGGARSAGPWGRSPTSTSVRGWARAW
ncbi:Transcriptional regulator OS=Streptomyces glaucescens OX=1907 GN=SGLAU_12935 PE=3 SV=1 [Streptomyces glaucescens]